MISELTIKSLIEEKLNGTENFLVDLSVSSSNQIRIEMDHPDGVKIDDCVAMSRHIESSLDRESEDFELEVSSPGLDHPFKVLQQYQKNMGREVSILKVSGEKLKGILTAVDTNEIEIEYSTKEKVEGKKKKEVVNHQIKILMADIKETRVIISFK